MAARLVRCAGIKQQVVDEFVREHYADIENRMERTEAS
jgi:hypothetical protein